MNRIILLISLTCFPIISVFSQINEEKIKIESEDINTSEDSLIKKEKNEQIERLKKELDELEKPPEPELLLPASPAQLIKEESDDDESVLEIQKKPTRPRTAKQIEQFKKVVENKMKNASERKKQAEIKADADKIELEDKLVKKAIAVKKKQIKKQKIIDDISSDEEEGDQVIQKMKPVKAKPAINAVKTSKYKFI